MPTFSKGRQDVLDQIASVMERYHGDLTESEVTVGCLMAHPPDGSEAGEPVLKLHGYACAAIVSITPYKQRVQGLPDALITIDAQTWVDLDDKEREAVLDHELEHLELQRDDEGNIRSDDQGRPKLKMKLHDLIVGGFAVIAKRHGRSALEVQAIRQIVATYRQEFFAWGDDTVEQDELDATVAGTKLSL